MYLGRVRLIRKPSLPRLPLPMACGLDADSTAILMADRQTYSPLVLATLLHHDAAMEAAEDNLMLKALNVIAASVSLPVCAHRWPRSRSMLSALLATMPAACTS